MLTRFAGLILFSLLNFAGISPADNNLILWSASRRLTWEDFKGRVPAGASNAALTSARINFKYGYGSDEGLTYNIACLFEKNSSWGRVKNDHILSHEQGHFDISEIHARKLNRAMKNYKYNNSTAAKDINAIYQSIVDQQAAMQNLYDDQTNYSRNNPQQAEWLKKIQAELEALKAYADYK